MSDRRGAEDYAQRGAGTVVVEVADSVDAVEAGTAPDGTKPPNEWGPVRAESAKYRT